MLESKEIKIRRALQSLSEAHHRVPWDLFYEINLKQKRLYACPYIVKSLIQEYNKSWDLRYFEGERALVIEFSGWDLYFKIDLFPEVYEEIRKGGKR